MVIQTRNSAKRSKPGDDASVVSDDAESPDILISSRSDEFSERTWWMVDMEQSDEGGGSTDQGATALVKRCMRTHGWTLEKARKVLTAYRQFLTLKKEKKDWDAKILSPSLLVDQMWHQHILDVVNYCHDMMLLCGRVVGHNPDGALSGKAERDEATRKALEERFANYDKEAWGLQAGDNSSSSKKTIVLDGANDTTNEAMITIHLREQDGPDSPFTVNAKTTKMQTIFDEIAARKGVPVDELIFIHSNRANPRAGHFGRLTPDAWGMKDNDTMLVYTKASYDNEKITVEVKGQGAGDTISFRLKGSTRMKKVMSAYAAEIGAPVSSLRFLLHGETIDGDATPTELWLGNNSQIDCFRALTGC